MASSSEDSPTSALRSLTSILVGVMGPSPDSAPDRLVLVNPSTQGMIILRGDPSTISQILAGSGGGGGAPPASKASIEALRSVEDPVEAEEECSVCLDALAEGEVKEMPCKHRFHGVCIEKWLRMHGSCPVCRFLMPREDGEGTKKDGDGEGRREVWITIAVSNRNERDDGGGVVEEQRRDQQQQEEEEEHREQDP